jgi:cobalamin synthase
VSSSSKKPSGPAARWKTVLTGMVLGFAWGSVMWLLSTVFGKNSGLAGWLYIALSMAMIGGGVAAVFGAVGAKRSGERVGPRFRRR